MKTVSSPGVTVQEAVEKIDIGKLKGEQIRSPDGLDSSDLLSGHSSLLFVWWPCSSVKKSPKELGSCKEQVVTG